MLGWSILWVCNNDRLRLKEARVRTDQRVIYIFKPLPPISLTLFAYEFFTFFTFFYIFKPLPPISLTLFAFEFFTDFTFFTFFTFLNRYHQFHSHFLLLNSWQFPKVELAPSCFFYLRKMLDISPHPEIHM